MLEPTKPGEGGGLQPTDPNQQKTQNQVDNKDMSVEDGEDGAEPEQPAG